MTQLFFLFFFKANDFLFAFEQRNKKGEETNLPLCRSIEKVKGGTAGGRAGGKKSLCFLILIQFNSIEKQLVCFVT